MARDMAMIADRWMMESRALVNWGSYDGYHLFRPSMDEAAPVTLLAGASESGKSTLVDAQISLLYPTGTPFNKASNSGRSERSDYTYLRGMVGAGDADGGETPIYLRGRDRNGTPEPVWGAIVDTYVNHTDGRVLSCAKFLYLQAGDGRGDVRRQYAVWDRRIDPRRMDALRAAPFTPSGVRTLYPGCLTFPNADAFHEHVWTEMGLSAQACRLLAKIQSADAPSRLDDIFKQGVLSIPDALAKARSLSEDYARYDANFRSMDDNMRRMGRLRGIRDAYERYAETLARSRTAAKASPATPEGMRLVKAWTTKRMRGELEAALPAERALLASAERDEREASRRADDIQRRLDTVRDRIRGIDGGALDRLTERLREAREAAERIRRNADRLRAAYAKTGDAMPHDAKAWEQARIEAVERTIGHETTLRELDTARDAAYAALNRTKETTRTLERDLETQRTARTRITRHMAETRAMLCQATGLDASDLPYVAELMDIREDDEAWRLAMNVAYAPISQTILVDKRHEQGFAAKISAIDPQRMARRTWRFVDVEHTPDTNDATDTTDGTWMSSKLRYREDSPFTPWLRELTRSERHDALCVETIDDTDRERRQIQRDGQLKSADRGQHGVKDRQQTIGFVTETYLNELQTRLEQAHAAEHDAQNAYRNALAAVERHNARLELSRTIAYTTWEDLDENGAAARIAAIERDIETLRGQGELSELEHERDDLADLRRQAEDERADLRRDAQSAARAIEAMERWLDTHPTDSTDTNLTNLTAPTGLADTIHETLETAYERILNGIDRPGLRARMIAGAGQTNPNAYAARLTATVGEDMKALADGMDRQTMQARAAVETLMAAYLDVYAADDDATGASVADYRYYMDELDGLTHLTAVRATLGEYRRCLERLRMGFLTLKRAIDADAAEIGDQLERINLMLDGQRFGPREGTLSLHADVRRPDAAFNAQLRRVIGLLNDWKAQGDAAGVDEAKRAFASCATMVGLLDEQLAQVRDVNGVRAYGARDLDPRCRSSFHATVHHGDGPDERITSTGGRSGGALQELTSFVYGAALMYLLGGGMDRRMRPSYTTLFLDEALIKADGRYTRRALAVLPRLGFQVVVSAPESKTGEILGVCTKAYVTWKDPDTGLTSLREASLAGADGADGAGEA